MKKYRNVIFIVLTILAFSLMLAFGQVIGQGVRDGLALAYRSVLPALFPAAVLCAVIGEMVELLPFPPTITLWAQSQLCGFPLGIKTVVRSYQRGLLSREQAIDLSCCCANASPAFLVNYVGIGILGSARAGFLLWSGQLMISFSIALRRGLFKGGRVIPPPPATASRFLAEGIASAAVGCLHLTGFIAFFSALAALPGFNHIHPLLEVTGGISQLKSGQLGLSGALIGFSGISVLLQNAGYLIAGDLPSGPMVKSKLFYTISLPLVSIGLEQYPWPTLTVFLLFILFLISFDKRRKRRYNKQERMILTRSVL